MTLVAMKASWRRPATASATISSARPSAYISAVSMWVRPRSSPRDSAGISSFLSLRSSPMCQVPWPTTATSTPVIPNGRLITRRVYTGRRWGGLAWPCRVAGAHSPAEPEDGRGETDQHRCGCERGQLGHPLDRGAAQAHEGEPDDREHGRATAHHRAAAGGQPEDAAEGAQHASGSAGSATPRDDGEPSAALHPEREVQCHEERHKGEAREVRRRHREAPLESERVVRGEPEQGQTPGLGEALPLTCRARRGPARRAYALRLASTPAIIGSFHRSCSMASCPIGALPHRRLASLAEKQSTQRRRDSIWPQK